MAKNAGNKLDGWQRMQEISWTGGKECRKEVGRVAKNAGNKLDGWQRMREISWTGGKECRK